MTVCGQGHCEGIAKSMMDTVICELQYLAEGIFFGKKNYVFFLTFLSFLFCFFLLFKYIVNIVK